MIYIKEKKLLFFRTRKVAGAAVEMALSANAGMSDIVAPMGIDEECIRIDLGGQFPVNWAEDQSIEQEYRTLVMNYYKENKSMRSRAFNLAAKITGLKKRQRQKQEQRHQLKKSVKQLMTRRIFSRHMRPDEIKKRLGEEKFSTAHKVTITRHPYEKLISDIYWLQYEGQAQETMSATIDAVISKSREVPYYLNEGRPICDTYIRYEHLQEDLRNLETRFGLNLVSNLPLVHNKIRTDRRPAFEILTRGQKEKCFEMNRELFDFFGYKNYL